MEAVVDKKHIKLFVSKNDFVTVVCPYCGLARQLDVSRFRNANKRLNGKCKCGESFICTIEFRKFFRKKVNLKGNFIFQGKAARNSITIQDISQQGMRFTTTDGCKVKDGNILEVNFRLDDNNKTLISKEVEVKSVHGQSIGCLFTNCQEYEKHLGFYLRP